MQQKIKRVFLKVLVFGWLIFGLLPGYSANALSDSLLKKFSQYDIMFYNPECSPGGTTPAANGTGEDPDDSWESWDGSCTAMTAQRAAWLKKQIPGMQAVATKNGIPWELIAGQALAESGGGASEICSYNPLGMKGSGPSCDGRHRSFSSYEEAYQHYVDSIVSIKAVKNKYPNNPYAAIAYVQYGSGAPYAQCSRQEYLTNIHHSCYGYKLGDPTPGYVNRTSSLICGIQKWAKSEGIAISSVTWENYSPTSSGNNTQDNSSLSRIGAIYCGVNGVSSASNDDGNDIDKSSLSALQKLVVDWAWPTYRGAGYINRKPAYAEYMDSKTSYHPCDGIDCGAFVSNVIRASGWDSSYPLGSTSTQRAWLASNWERLSTGASLKAGDVGIKTGHVILYVGDIAGFESKTASASSCTGPNRRAPMAGSPRENLNQYTWYRKK